MNTSGILPADAEPESDSYLALARRRALAQLIQLLKCGEESAALAFDILARRRRHRGDNHALCGALASIADDERKHEQLLSAWQRTLPAPVWDPAGNAVAVRFFRDLGTCDAGDHLTRIAALDSAVCVLLRSLRKAQPGLFGACLSQILADEAGHVALASGYARRHSPARRRQEQAAATRDGLVRLLATSADCLEALQMNPEQLLPRLRRPPRFLCG
jgi:hypothetical protein